MEIDCNEIMLVGVAPILYLIDVVALHPESNK